MNWERVVCRLMVSSAQENGCRRSGKMFVNLQNRTLSCQTLVSCRCLWSVYLWCSGGHQIIDVFLNRIELGNTSFLRNVVIKLQDELAGISTFWITMIIGSNNDSVIEIRSLRCNWKKLHKNCSFQGDLLTF